MVSLDAADKSSGSGLFGRLKNRFFGSRADSDESQPEADDEAPAAAFDEIEGGAFDEEGDQNALLRPPAATAPAPAPEPEPTGPPRAGLRVAARVSTEEDVGGGTIPMRFALFTSETNGEPFFTEEQSDVLIAGGRFEVVLGAGRARFEGIPERVWVEISIDGDTLSPRALVTRQRSVVNF